MNRNIIVYDDYNGKIKADQSCIGTITTNIGSSTPRNGTKIIEFNEVDNMENELRVRKLTPKECFRLMGFDDSDHDVLAENGISNTQIYKMAGNSIVVDVLEAIFNNLNDQYTL